MRDANTLDTLGWGASAGRPRWSQDLRDHGSVLDRSKKAQPPAAAGARKDIDLEGPGQQINPRMVFASGVAGSRCLPLAARGRIAVGPERIGGTPCPGTSWSAIMDRSPLSGRPVASLLADGLSSAALLRTLPSRTHHAPAHASVGRKALRRRVDMTSATGH